MICEDCKLDLPTVRERHSQTAYHWDGTGEDPNRNAVLCDECAAEYKAHWDSMWDNYRSSQGF